MGKKKKREEGGGRQSEATPRRNPKRFWIYVPRRRSRGPGDGALEKNTRRERGRRASLSECEHILSADEVGGRGEGLKTGEGAGRG